MKFIHSFLLIAGLCLSLGVVRADSVQQEQENVDLKGLIGLADPAMIEEDCEEIDWAAALADLDDVPPPTLEQHIKLAWVLTKNFAKDHPVLVASSGVTMAAVLVVTVVYLVKHSKRSVPV